MQNIDVKSVATNGVMPSRFSSQVLQGYVAIEDLAEAAKIVILDPETHNRARYEIVGQNITIEEVARSIAQCAGKGPIPCVSVPREQVMFAGMDMRTAQGQYAKEGVDRMLYYYDHRCVDRRIGR